MRVFTSNVLIQLLEVHEHTFATPTTELFPSVLAHVTNEGVPMLELEGTNLTRVRIGLVMDPHVDSNIRDLGSTQSTLVVFDPSVLLPIMFQHLRQGVESEAAIWALEILVMSRGVAQFVSLHPLGFSGPEVAGFDITVHPLTLRFLGKGEMRFTLLLQSSGFLRG